MLCQLCSSFDFNNIMQLRLESCFNTSFSNILSHSDFDVGERILHFSPGRADCEPEDFLIPYHRTLKDLFKASEECDLCRALLHSARDMIMFRKAKNDRLCAYPPGQGLLFLCGLGKGQGIQLMGSDQCDFPYYALLGGVGFYVDRDSPINHTIHGRTIPESPQSKDSLGSISEWLSDCTTHHQHYVNNTIKPTRLLRYEHDKGKVSLCTSIVSDIKYAALSHCWGSVQPLTLNNGTKHQLEQGLPLDAFPKTFQDAFWLINQLGIPYIWIDSLCILQDDNDDWVHESARMCDVYGNAYLTIAATRAANCSEGFLGPREGPGYSYVPFRQDGIHDNVAISPIPLRRISPWSGIIDLEKEPLSKRSWALQERYLPPRTVHFASDQMYFECRSGFHTQDNHMKTSESEPEFKIHRITTAKDDDELQDAWGAIVLRYTQRYLTVETDKLPAIGGLAARVFLERTFNGDPGEEYLAGIWRTNLLWDLAWKVIYGYALRDAPMSYTAPSWSWASINQPLEFLGPEDIQSLAIVKGAKVDLENPGNPFGQVTGGWVHLSCVKLHPCDVEYDDDDLSIGHLYFGDGEASFRVAVALDPPRFNLPRVRLADYSDKKPELVAVPLTLHFDNGKPLVEGDNRVYGAYFLILISSNSLAGPFNGPPRYRRVGVGTSFESDDRDMPNSKNARRQMENRCMAAMKQETLEDIIIV